MENCSDCLQFWFGLILESEWTVWTTSLNLEDHTKGDFKFRISTDGFAAKPLELNLHSGTFYVTFYDFQVILPLFLWLNGHFHTIFPGWKSFLTSFQFSFIFISIVAIWIHDLIFLKIICYILAADGNRARENFKKSQLPLLYLI